MTSFFTRFFKRLRKPQPYRRQPKLGAARLTLGVEMLERRDLRSGMGVDTIPLPPPQPTGIYYDSLTQVLTIIGSKQNDTVEVSVAISKSLGDHAGTLEMGTKVTLGHGAFNRDGTPVDPETKVIKDPVSKIVFWGDDGNDQFTNWTEISTTAYGNDGNDTLKGGNCFDMKLYGGNGNDQLYGGDNADLIYGGADDDTVYAGGGEDTVYGQAGQDKIHGGTGDDTVYGGSDDDDLYGEDGADHLYGEDGNDQLLGGNNDDTLSGGNDDDELHGDAGKDTMDGGAGMDMLWGGSEDDTLIGGDGDDELHGEAGKDTLIGDDLLWGPGVGNDDLYGEGGDDQLFGGPGKDWLEGDDGEDYLDGGADNDILYGDMADYSLYGDDDELHGGAGDDQLHGEDGNDLLFGDDGNDQLSGNDGNDELHGGGDGDAVLGDDGDDTLYGDGGNDLIDGAAGIDQIHGGADDDELHGGDLNDKLYGDDGNDVLFGEDGADYLEGGSGIDEFHGGGNNFKDWLETSSKYEVADGGFSAYGWAINGTTFDDIDQEGSPTCVFLASLAGVANSGADLAGHVVYAGNYHYHVELYRDGVGWVFRNVTFDGTYSLFDHPNSHDVGDPFDDPAPHNYEFWTILFQRAYLAEMQYQGKSGEIGSFYYEPMQMLTGKSIHTYIYSGGWDDPQALHDTLANGGAVIVANADEEPDGVIQANHAYAVLSCNWDASQNQWIVTLYNPHHKDDGPNPWGDPFDGIVQMTWEELYGSYYDFDVMAKTL